MSADLHELIIELDLNDVTIAGFSMGGGEVARYFGQFGSERVSKAMLTSAVPPYLKKTPDNSDGGLEQKDIDGFMNDVKDDRIAFLDDFGKQFVNFDELGGERISEDLVHYNKTIASFASPKATQDCITAFAETDFRDDLKKIDVPVLVVHCGADQVVPPEVSGERSADMIADSRLEVLEGAPHGLNYTHTKKLNNLMKDFLSS